jgi:hypothetical protein
MIFIIQKLTSSVEADPGVITNVNTKLLYQGFYFYPKNEYYMWNNYTELTSLDI